MTFQKLTLTQICLIEGQSHGQVFFYCKKDVEIKFGSEGFIFARLVTFYVHRTFKKTFLEVSSKSAKLWMPTLCITLCAVSHTLARATIPFARNFSELTYCPYGVKVLSLTEFWEFSYKKTCGNVLGPLLYKAASCSPELNFWPCWFWRGSFSSICTHTSKVWQNFWSVLINYSWSYGAWRFWLN